MTTCRCNAAAKVVEDDLFGQGVSALVASSRMRMRGLIASALAISMPPPPS
jgi:hypothetical protein